MEKRNFNNDFQNYKEAYIKFKEYINQGITIDEIAYCYNLPIERINNILIRFDEFIDPVIDIQIEKVINIFNQTGIPKIFYLYGNHEQNVELYDKISLKEELKELNNLIYIGKGNSYIKLNDNDPINICHKLSSDETCVPNFETNLKLEGHPHCYN